MSELTTKDWINVYSDDEQECIENFGADDFQDWAETANDIFGPLLFLKKASVSGEMVSLDGHERWRDLYARSCYIAYSSNEDLSPAEVIREAAESLRTERLAREEEQRLAKERELEQEIEAGVQEHLRRMSESLSGEGINNGLPGYVYVIRDTDTGLIKIGRTESWIRRSKELKVDEDQIMMMNVRWVPDSIATERHLHERYKEYRLPQSEWFRIDHVPVV